ncbi:MAG: type II toxin-antitoxin system YafO family toxin [Methylococcales bacterium]
MTVKITNALESVLGKNDADLLCSEFLNWKATGEYDHHYFGKDSAYIAPPVNGEKYALRHVHLVPVLDVKQIARWWRDFARRGRKTSDRVLIYAKDAKENYLLIYILTEPDAHKIATMKNQTDKELMESFAKVAGEFMFDGSVII